MINTKKFLGFDGNENIYSKIYGIHEENPKRIVNISA